MKKIVITASLILGVLGWTGAQTEIKNIEVSLNIAKILVFSSVTNVPLGTIQPGVGISGSGEAKIRTNYYSWKVEVYALNGAMREWISNPPVTVPPTPIGFKTGGASIPYTFSFNTADTTTGRFFANKTLGTAPSTETTATFTSRTTGGTDGQVFGYTIDVAAPTGTDDWNAGEYRDTIYMKVTVN